MKVLDSKFAQVMIMALLVIGVISLLYHGYMKFRQDKISLASLKLQNHDTALNHQAVTGQAVVTPANGAPASAVSAPDLQAVIVDEFNPSPNNQF